MSDPVRRLLFDECIGRPVMEKLRELVPQGIEFYHIVGKYTAGDKDEDWIPKLGIEGGWVVITSDAGRNSKVGQKLPDLCIIHKITHVILKGRLHHKTTLEKISLIAAAWRFFENVFTSPQGSRYFMRLRSKKGTQSLTVSVELCQVTAELLAIDSPEDTQPTNA